MTDISPLSREEKQLRKLLGQSIETEIPRSRIEFLLQEIIDGGGVGGGSYKIKDQYATLADLEAAHPTGADGDAYLVGDPTHIYVWLDDRQEYADGGLFAAVPGLDGNGIVSIEKTATAGLVDTYTVTYTDGTTDTFNVTNGAAGAPGADGEDGVGITDIQKTSTVGLVDTYTITLTDGSTYDFTVTNGSGGSGVPEGGTTGQVLTKKSNADGDVEWTTPSGGSAETSALESLSAENSEQASEIGSLSTETSEMASELSSLSAAASEMASDIASTSTAQSEVDSNQNVALNSLSTENSTQTSEIGSLSQSMSEIASAASSTSTAQSEMDSTQNAGLASLSTENSTQASELTSLSTENSTQSSEIDSLSTAQSELGSEIDVIGSELDEKQGTLTEGPGIDIDNDVISTEVNIFTGTMTEWEQLSLAEKLEYTHAAIKNDSKSGIIDLVPTENSLHAVSSGGVYDELALKQNITDNTLKTTNKTIPGAINELYDKDIIDITNQCTVSESVYCKVTVSPKSRSTSIEIAGTKSTGFGNGTIAVIIPTEYFPTTLGDDFILGACGNVRFTDSTYGFTIARINTTNHKVIINYNEGKAAMNIAFYTLLQY